MGKMKELAQVEARIAETWSGFWSLTDAEQETLRAEYRTVLQPALLEAYGEDGPATKVDPWLAESFWELYKDRNGVRPHGEFSYRYVKDWMDGLKARDAAEAAAMEEVDTDAYYATDFDAETLDRIADFEDVYGVAAFGQAARFVDLREF